MRESGRIGTAEKEPAGEWEHVRCDLCGVDDARPLFEKHGRRVVRCRRCGLGYVSPRPSWIEITRIYETENYYHNENVCDFGYGDYLGEQAALLEPLFAQRVVDVEAFQPTRGRLLDVGCASGLLLLAARAAGWDVEGVDVSPFAVNYCRQRGLTVHLGPLEDQRFPTGRFNVIVMDDTVEHLAAPRRAIEEAHRILAPGGLLTINTCDEGGLLRLLMGRHWFHYKPIEHLWYFSRATLARLLGECGFRVLDTRLSGKLVTLTYLCERLAAYSPAASALSLRTLARLPGASRPFFLPIGEFVVYARRE